MLHIYCVLAIWGTSTPLQAQLITEPTSLPTIADEEVKATNSLSPTVVSKTDDSDLAEAFFNKIANTANSAASSASKAVLKMGDLVFNALGLIGVNYRYGGNAPSSGLDCSGFVRYVFNDTLGLSLPRRAAQMSKVGEKIDKNALRPGDLVFFNTMRRTFSHVGIYIGDNKFVHAPRTGKQIRVDNLQSTYWISRYNGARRISESEAMKINAEEIERLRSKIKKVPSERL